MKRILLPSLVALAALGLGVEQASAVCFDVYKPCVRIPLPRLPIFCPKICIGCDPEGKQGGCGANTCGAASLLFNKSFCYSAFGSGNGCASCGQGYSGGGHCGHCGHCGHACGTRPYPHAVDCNRPLFPNPGYGYMCWDGAVGPWYGYFPPPQPTGYQVGPYGGFRGPVATPGYAPAAASMPTMAYNNNVPSYWYGR
jgi:hypothetical protein